LLRTLEVHGRCWVADENATDCPPAVQYPLAQYYYWAPTELSNRRNRLQKVAFFPHGTAGISLETTYDEYDAYGSPTRVIDANNVPTTFTYEENRVKTRTKGTALTTTATITHSSAGLSSRKEITRCSAIVKEHLAQRASAVHGRPKFSGGQSLVLLMDLHGRKRCDIHIGPTRLCNPRHMLVNVQ
jgi:hypothetical protein